MPIGTVRRIADVATLKCEGFDARAIHQQSRAGIDLARVRTPDEATLFVGKYGPLGVWPDGALTSSEETIGGITTLKRPISVQQPLTEVLRVAQHLRELIDVALDARRAAAGNWPAHLRLAQWAEARRLDTWSIDEGFTTLPELVTGWLQHDFDEYASAARARVVAASPGVFEIRLLSDSLLTFCYINAAESLTQLESLGACPECARVFIIDDGRQRYCEPRCANRARFRRFKEQQQEGSRDTKTRTR